MADRVVPQRDLRNHYAELVQEAAAGSEITITDRGRPVARLGPLGSRRRRVPGAEANAVLREVAIDYDSFMADVRPPDRDRILDDPDPWASRTP